MCGGGGGAPHQKLPVKFSKITFGFFTKGDGRGEEETFSSFLFDDKGNLQQGLDFNCKNLQSVWREWGGGGEVMAKR